MCENAYIARCTYYKRTIGVLVFYKAKTSTLQKVIILPGWNLVERGIHILILLGIDGTECSIENLIKYSYCGDSVLLFPAVLYAVYNPRKPMQ